MSQLLLFYCFTQSLNYVWGWWDKSLNVVMEAWGLKDICDSVEAPFSMVRSYVGEACCFPLYLTWRVRPADLTFHSYIRSRWDAQTFTLTLFSLIPSPINIPHDWHSQIYLHWTCAHLSCTWKERLSEGPVLFKGMLETWRMLGGIDYLALHSNHLPLH